MTHIRVTEGLDIPISGRAEGTAQELPLPSQISLNLSTFHETKFKLLVKVGEQVRIGQPLASDKSSPDRLFVSPAGGIVAEIRRGLKRRLMDIVINVGSKEERVQFDKVDPERASSETILKALLKGGIFAHIRQRPFGRLANPAVRPRSIFVKAIESAPFVPDPAMQVAGYEREFQAGLTALSKLTDGKVHLVYPAGSTCAAFTQAKQAELHTVEGPHPAGNYSLHIHQIDPIGSVKDVVWTVTAHDVVCMGDLLLNGRVHLERIVAIAGPGIHADRRAFVRVRAGFPIGNLVAGRNVQGLVRLISGDPLMGERVEVDDFLKFHHFVFCAICEHSGREFLHFFRPGFSKYSFHKVYVSGHLSSSQREYDMTTNMHGEERAFVDPWIYNQVMPMRIPVTPLVKAVITGDYDKATELGLLEVDPEDFALPTFICPSKIEMVDIMRDGLARCAAEVLSR